MARAALESFEADVEAARLGRVFSGNLRAYRKWRRSIDGRSKSKAAPMSDAALEATIMRIAAEFPDNIERVTA